MSDATEIADRLARIGQLLPTLRESLDGATMSEMQRLTFEVLCRIVEEQSAVLQALANGKQETNIPMEKCHVDAV